MSNASRNEPTFEPLIELATPDLYRHIAFRLLELPVHASDRDVARRRELMEKAERSGLAAVPPGAGRILPLGQVPDEHALLEASHALQDAQRRLVHEWFWFWPLPPSPAAADPALRHLVAGDVGAALAVWREASGAQRGVAGHNLAVWHHLKALEAEAALLEAPVEGKVAGNGVADADWKAAHAHWQASMEDERLWSLVSERIRRIDDARLAPAAADRLRDSLPTALALALARLVVRAMDAGRTAQALRLARHLTSAGWGESVLEEARRIAIEPVRALCKSLRTEARARAAADKPHADAVVEQMLDRVSGPLAVLDLLLPPTHAARQAERDEIADDALGCVIDFQNATQKVRRSVALLDRIEPLAFGTAVKDRIARNRAVAGDLLQDAVCWTCGQNDGDERLAVEVKLHGEVRTEPVPGGTRTTWRHGSYKVPRCAQCVAEERLMARSGGIALLVFNLGLAAAVALFLRVEWWGLAAASTAAVVALALASRDRAARRRRCRPELVRRARDDFPPIRERLAAGWKPGEKPVGA